MTYNELHYERIDLDESKTKLAKMITDFKNADNAADQIGVIQKIACLIFSRVIHSKIAK